MVRSPCSVRLWASAISSDDPRGGGAAAPVAICAHGTFPRDMPRVAQRGPRLVVRRRSAITLQISTEEIDSHDFHQLADGRDCSRSSRSHAGALANAARRTTGAQGRAVRIVPQIDHDKALRSARVANLERVATSIEGPIVLVAHSMGCCITVHWHGRRRARSRAHCLPPPPTWTRLCRPATPTRRPWLPAAGHRCRGRACRSRVLWSAAATTRSEDSSRSTPLQRPGEAASSMAATLATFRRPMVIATGRGPRSCSASCEIHHSLRSTPGADLRSR